MNKAYGQTLLDDMVRHQSLPMPLVKQAAREILTIIREGLIRDGVVNVSNFGTFRLKTVAARKGINPQTREPLTIPAHHRVIFSPCKALRELIQPEHKPPVPIQPAATTNATDRNATIASVSSIASERMQPPDSLPPAEVENTGGVVSAGPVAPAPNSDALSPPENETTEEPVFATSVQENAAESFVQPDAEPTSETVAAPHTVQPENSDITESTTFFLELEGDKPSETEAPNTSSKKPYYLGAAAVLVIVLVSAFLLTDPSPKAGNTETTLVSAVPVIESPATVPTSPVSRPEQAEVMVKSNTTAEPTASAKTTDEESDAPGPYPGVHNQALVAEPIAHTSPTRNSDRRDDQQEMRVSTVTGKSLPPVGTQVSNQYFTEQIHEITHGESLWRLAESHYQDPLLWPHIYQANTGTLDDPDHLLEGSTIIIPGLEGSPDSLSKTDRRSIAEGYYLTYLHYKKIGRKEAFFALLEAKRYDREVVEEHRKLLQLTSLEEILLNHQQTMPF